jgi:hypothetical protein
VTQQQIDQAIQDQIQTSPTELPPSNPEIDLALSNYAAEAARMAAALNESLIANFNVGFANWADQVKQGKIPNTSPPKPPAGYIAAKATNGWTYVIRGTDPVCSMPDIPPMPAGPIPSGTMVIGKQIGMTQYWSAPGDTMPIGYQTPVPVKAQDGAMGFFERTGDPFGGWWLKIG